MIATLHTKLFIGGFQRRDGKYKFARVYDEWVCFGGSGLEKEALTARCDNGKKDEMALTQLILKETVWLEMSLNAR